MISNNNSLEKNLREYCKFPSLLLREINGYNELPPRAMDLWQNLFEMAKYDKTKTSTIRTVKICINKLCQMLSRKRRTVEEYLQRLEEKGFIKRYANFSERGYQLINTYLVIVPQFIIDKVNNSNKIVSIQSSENSWVLENTSPAEKCGTFNISKSFEDINNNYKESVDNCYFSLNSKKEKDLPIKIITEQPALESEIDIVKIYPSWKRPESKAKTLFRHCINKTIQFENVILEKLTKAQTYAISFVVKHFAAKNAEKDLMTWIENSILNPNAYSRCQNFFHKLNAIIKDCREGKFTRPFKLRYNQDNKSDNNTMENKRRSDETALETIEKARRTFQQGNDRYGVEVERKSAQQQEKLTKIDQWRASLERATEKYNEAIKSANYTYQRIYSEAISLYKDLLQGEGHCA